MKNNDVYMKTFEVASLLKRIALLAVAGCLTAIPVTVNAQTINTKTTVTDSGGKKTTTGTDDVSKTTGATLKQDVAAEKVKDKKAEAEKAAEERKEDVNDVNYTGVYNGRQIVPDIMAIYCKTNAEQFLADPSLMDKCLNRYLAAMNNANASLRADGVKDYNALVLRAALDAFATATTKSASVANYEDVQNDMADKSRQGQTEREDGAAISNTTSVTTDVINSLRELYASRLFVEAVQALEAVDPSVIDQDVVDEVNKEAEKASRDVSEDTDFAVQTEAELKNQEEIDDGGVDPDEAEAAEEAERAAVAEQQAAEKEADSAITFVGNGQCSSGGKTVACANGTYKDQYGKEWVCDGGICMLKSLLDAEEAANASEKEKETAAAAGTFVGNGQCSAEGKTVACADGKHTDQYGKEWSCEGGICIMQSTLDAEEKYQKTQENLAAAKKLSPDKLKKAVEAYRNIINDSTATDSMKAEAQEYLDILNQAAPTVLSDMPCAQAKREYGLSISCNDWNK